MTIDIEFDVGPHPRRWSRGEYYRLAEEGYFDGQRVELVEGEIVEKSRQSRNHAATIHLAADALNTAIGPNFWVRMQGPLVLDEWSEPEPDIAVIPGTPRDYPKHPQGALPVVEVSDATRTYDLGTKSRLYAAARGIPEYWVVDLIERELVVMLDPRRGEYQSSEPFDLKAKVKPRSIKSKLIRVADLFP